MTLGQIIGPVAAASAVNCALLGFAWRATQIERRTGRAPWYLGAGIVVYGGAMAAFGYAYGEQPTTTGPELFAVSLGAEALGAVVILGVAHAIYRKDRQPPAQRAFEIGMSLMLLVGILWAGLLS